MKLKFSDLQNLDNQRIIEGIRHCLINSNDLFNSATLLRKEKKTGIAISLLILSVEELMKALGFLNLIIHEDKTLAKEFFDARDLHKTRLHLALLMNEFLKELDFKEFTKKNEDLDLKNPQIIVEFLNKIDFKKIEKNIEKEEKELSNWFLLANETKNNGIYVSFGNNNWQTPQKILVQEYTIAFRQTKRIRNYFSLLILIFMTTNTKEFEDFLETLKSSLNVFIENIDENTTANTR